MWGQHFSLSLCGTILNSSSVLFSIGGNSCAVLNCNICKESSQGNILWVFGKVLYGLLSFSGLSFLKPLHNFLWLLSFCVRKFNLLIRSYIHNIPCICLKYFCKEWCDRCTWPLDQTGGDLVQAPEEMKSWAIAGPRTPLLSIRSLKTHKGAEWHSEHRCIRAWNTNHAINLWKAGGFSKTHLSRNKESCGYKESHAYLPT